MYFKQYFIVLVILNIITGIVGLLVAKRAGQDIKNTRIQYKICFWSTLPFLLLMAIFDDISFRFRTSEQDLMSELSTIGYNKQ
jgi:hypothetical protein